MSRKVETRILLCAPLVGGGTESRTPVFNLSLKTFYKFSLFYKIKLNKYKTNKIQYLTSCILKYFLQLLKVFSFSSERRCFEYYCSRQLLIRLRLFILDFLSVLSNHYLLIFSSKLNRNQIYPHIIQF